MRFYRRLARDVGLAALIAFPAILPVTPTPRTIESPSGATAPQLLVADADLSASPWSRAESRL